jgi:hypothetical protein
MKRKLLALSLILSTQQLFAQDITSNLEAYFSFNDGTANVTAGQVTQAGSVYGAISDNDRFGNPNKAMFFDGINDYIDFGNLSNYQFGSNSFTLALWIKASMSQSGQGIPIGKRGFSGGDMAYMFGWDSNGPGTTTGELMLYYRDDNGDVGYSNWQTEIVAGNSWRHIAMVFDRSVDNLYFFVDGVLENTRDISGLSTFNATGSSAGQLMAGRSSEGGQYYIGLLDDIYIFRRALNQNEISALYNAANPILSISETIVNVLHAFPNPTKDQLTLSVTGNTAVQITDMSGTIIDRIEIIGQTNIDVSSYAQGVYFIRTAEGQTVKFIKE